MRYALACILFLLQGAVVAAERSPETEALYAWLGRTEAAPALGGQWNGGNKSYGWLEQMAVLGREPLVYGIEYYDYGPLERRLDAREEGTQIVLRKYQQAGVVTLVDHMPNFVTGGNAWDRGGDALSAVLPGGSAHADYVAYLDRLAVFLQQLWVDESHVPVLWRPLHEMNGSWFWWGDADSGDRFVALWRFSWDYLTRVKGVRNVIWVWSPNARSKWGEDEFRRYWPGDAYVDVVAMDAYDNQPGASPERSGMVSTYAALARIASKARLPMAISEIGFKHAGHREADFWEKRFWPFVQKLRPAPSYILVWNYDYGPRAGTPAAEGFARLKAGFLLQGDVGPELLYGTRGGASARQ